MSVLKAYVWRKKESPDIEEDKSIGLKFTGDRDKNGTLKAKVDREAKKYRVLKASRNDEPFGDYNLYKWWLDVEDTSDGDIGPQLAAKMEPKDVTIDFPVWMEKVETSIKALKSELAGLKRLVEGSEHSVERSESPVEPRKPQTGTPEPPEEEDFSKIPF